MSPTPPVDPTPEAAPSVLHDLAHDLRGHALAYPEAWEDFPWGEVAVKVRKKAFLFLGASDDRVSFTVKLRDHHTEALEAAFTEPSGYGLGRHGWVTGRIGPHDTVDPARLRAWIDESYRLVAPKKLVKVLDAGG